MPKTSDTNTQPNPDSVAREATSRFTNELHKILLRARLGDTTVQEALSDALDANPEIFGGRLAISLGTTKRPDGP